MMHRRKHRFMNFFKGLDHKIENNGDNLTITISGDTEKIARLERKLNAMKELCFDNGNDETE